MSGERVAYWIARMLVAAVGLWLIVVAAVVLIIVPTSVALRLVGIAVGLPLGALMLCPNRLTVAGRRFRYRLAVSIFVGLYFIAAGLAAIPAGFDGEHDPRVLVCVPVGLLIGFGLPGCLWWRSRLAARKETSQYQEV